MGPGTSALETRAANAPPKLMSGAGSSTMANLCGCARPYKSTLALGNRLLAS